MTLFLHKFFILCAEILEKMVRDSKSISGIKINEKEFRLSQYADDTQIFLDGTEKSLKETLTGGFLLLQKFCVAISVSPHVCFILVLILISMFLR